MSGAIEELRNMPLTPTERASVSRYETAARAMMSLGEKLPVTAPLALVMFIALSARYDPERPTVSFSPVRKKDPMLMTLLSAASGAHIP